MSTKIGINGFGRIGRIAFRIAAENSDVEIVGVNDLLDVEHLAYLLKYDAVHGNFKGSVDVQEGNLVVNGNTAGFNPCVLVLKICSPELLRRIQSHFVEPPSAINII